MTTSRPPATDLENLTGSWVLDPARSTAVFHTKAMWVMKVTGSAKILEGHGTRSAAGDVSGTLVIDAASIDTGNAKRDTHLRTADFFDVAQHPTITFTANSATPAPDGLEVAGTLTVHGQTRPLTLHADVTTGPDSALTVTAEVDIDRSNWGMGWTKMGAAVANKVLVTAHFDKI